MYIATIGVDRYRGGCPPLHNAVNDARGVQAVFEECGFVPAVEPLIDDAATKSALSRLVSHDLTRLGADDSLVVFFAGHGHTVSRARPDGPSQRRGYLLPVDAVNDRRDTWLCVNDWLSEVAFLRARHILVILDSCYSGIALGHDTQWRGYAPPPDPAVDPLRARDSRRVITSALDNQVAEDGGPIPGHSLFTGCLIHALRGGIRKSQVTGQALGVHVQEDVRARTRSQQTPAIGTLEGDAQGELFIELGKRRRKPRRVDPPKPGPERPTRVGGLGPPTLPPLTVITGLGGPPAISPRSAQPYEGMRGADDVRGGEIVSPRVDAAVAGHAALARTEGWILDEGLAAALDRQGAQRTLGDQVLTVVAGEAVAAKTAWATWAAQRGYLVLVTQAHGLDAAIADLLAQTPWLRCLPEARRRLAAAAGLDVAAVDAALDARSPAERQTWIADVAALDRHAQVSGWLLAALRRSSAGLPELATAPVQGGELLAIACDLACPTAVLIQHPTPDAAWLAPALATAAGLIRFMPRHAVAVTAPAVLVEGVLQGPGSALAMARQGLVRLTGPAVRSPGRGRGRTLRALFDALERDARTRGRFALDTQVALADGADIDVDLVATTARIAVELDGWHHFQDPEGYLRDRIQDARLQRAGYFVLRFLTEDVDDRLASTIDQIAIALAGRRAQRAQSGGDS